MKVSYKPKKPGKTVKDLVAIKMNYGTHAKKINQRLEEFKAAKNLEDIRKIPNAKCHELTNNRKGELAVSISGNNRIIFIPEHEPIPKKEDGGLDWSQVTQITITAINIDYH